MNKKRNFIHWTGKEIEQLELLVGNVPYPVVWKYYNSWANQEGFLCRTKRAIYCKIKALGLSKEMIGNWLTVNSVAKILGVSECTPRRWATHKFVKAVKFSERKSAPWYVKRSDLVKLAKEKPYLFGGISANNLFNLFENKKLAEEIAEKHPRRPIDPRPVIAMETKKVFPSIAAASKKMFVHPSAILHAIRTNGTSAGVHWRFVNSKAA